MGSTIRRMTTYPKFVILVLLIGRDDEIRSHGFGTRADAEADLSKIMEAQQSGQHCALPWLTMKGDQIQAAYIKDESVSISAPIAVPRRDDPFSPTRW
jgi:hypothetical protein